MILIKNTNSKINNVIHIADIHIRLTKRHDEYLSVFDKFYSILDKLKLSTNVVLVIAGDIFHNKSDFSPECVEIGSNFLKNCADRIPTILIAGNHDATLANKSRLDCLTPIVNALQHSNLYYLKTTDIYRYENILFNNFSVFDDPDTYIKYENIPSKYKLETDHHIALFHGPVNNAITDIGYTVSNRAITNELFDGHHIVMLGDIHKFQMLQEYDAADNKPVIVYCGSTLQQNHGEDLKGHGFVMWDLKRKLFKHYELLNEYGFYTLEINKGKLVTDISNIPKKTRIRTKCLESLPSQIKSILTEIKSRTEILETTFIRVEEPNIDLILKTGHSFEIHNIFDVDYQNKLIESNLIGKCIDRTTINLVMDINKKINRDISKDTLVKNIRWKPKVFEFDNMFSYGEGNIIDFSKIKGNIGLFAPNSSGKSSIMDALAFCIFDKFSKGFKAIHVLNTQKMSFRCKFNFDVNGVDYFIERIGNSDKKGNVKVNVKFWKLEHNNVVELNGEARRSTNDVIRDYVGTYEDFILTVLSIQNGKDESFIDLGQTDRKDLLCQFMGLNVFDQLYTIANDNFKETNSLLKNISKDLLIVNLDDVSTNIKLNGEQIDVYNNKIKEIEITKEKCGNELLNLSNNIIRTDSLYTDIVKLEIEKHELDIKINEHTSQLSSSDEKLNNIHINLNNLSSSILQCTDIEQHYDLYKSWRTKEVDKLNMMETLKVVIKGKIDKLTKLESHKYDPNCTYCINNVFVKDAIKTKEDLEQDKGKVRLIVEEYNSIKLSIDSFGDIESKYKFCQQLNNDKQLFETQKSAVTNFLLRQKNIIMGLNNTVKTVNDRIDTFYKNKDIIDNNNKLLTKISDCKDLIKNIDKDIKLINNSLFTLSTEKGMYELQYKNTMDQLNKMKELESHYEAYKLYTSIMSRDGIPYEIITNTLPDIEREVNNILQHIVEFNISLKTDGKNITTDIVYDDRMWPLEMAGGMEKFISGLAIRVALISISNLPRPNIICIDEGWGTLDSSNLASVGSMLSFLKNSFDFVWIISHLDQMRDMVDEQIEIKKENGYSKVIFK